MSIKTMKVAISLPKDILQEIENLRHKLGLARSQAILEAVSLWLKKKEEENLEKRYVEGYKRKPEIAKDIDPLFLAGLSSFTKDSW